jgi:hypothetical protein
MRLQLTQYVNSNDWQIRLYNDKGHTIYDKLSGDWLTNSDGHTVLAALDRMLDELTMKLTAFSHPLYLEPVIKEIE